VLGVICLQGGAEFGPACRDMDAELVRRAGDGPVVVSALAGAVGRDYQTATANGVRHFTELGAPARPAPDYRTDPDEALAVLRTARLIVLPGGSPRRLRDAVVGTPVGGLLAAHVAGGGLLMGASAGAMVLCDRMILPESGEPEVVDGLGLVRRCLVIPHYRGGSPWVALAPAASAVLGLPECSGVFVEDGTATAAGAEPVTVVWKGEPLLLAPGDSVRLP
jgi:cyanophycinase-like exopeptidase